MSRRRTAYHEAGHIVAALLHGGVAHHVSISAEDYEAGYAFMGVQRWDLGMVTLAGDVAELLKFGRRQYYIFSHGASEDLREAEQLAAALAAERAALLGGPHARLAEPKYILRGWRDACRSMLRSRWAAVELLAERLYTAGSLTGAEIAELLGPLGLGPDAEG